MSLKLSGSCLEVVCVCAGIYFGLKNKGYSLALVRRGYSTAKPYFQNTLNIFMKHFSRQIFLVCRPPSFCRLSFGYESFTE